MINGKKTDGPVLSIVVPVYNVEEYLLECLESIEKSIRNIDAEVLLIDDGSKDDSGVMAKAFADTHQGFFYYRKENGGLSDARNFGAARAQGKYLCFVDSDDVVRENMYENMLAAAEHHQADLTIVNVMRFDSTGPRESSLHDKVFIDLDCVVTHIDECDNLIYDTTAWNKLIRRDFWERNGFQYPVGWRFEDMPVSLAMHTTANKVAIVRETGYMWRDRDGRTRSITQENNSIVNLTHRLTMTDGMYDFLEKERDDGNRLRDLMSFKILMEDLPMYINMAAAMDDDELAEEYRDTIKSFISRHMKDSDFEKLPAAHRLKYRLLEEDRKEELQKLIAFEKRKYKNLPFVRKDGETFIELPEEMFGIAEVSAANDIADRMPESAITDIEINGPHIGISAYCFIRRVSVPDPEDMEIRCCLFNSVTGEKKELSVERFPNHKLTKKIGAVYDGHGKKVSNYDYDGSGFRVTIDLDGPDTLERFKGSNCILVHYKAEGKQGTYPLKSPEPEWDRTLGGKILACANADAQIRFDTAGALWLGIDETEDKHGQIPAPADAAACTVRKENDTAVTVTVNMHPGAGGEQKAVLAYYDALAQRDVCLAEAADEEAGEDLAFTIDISNEGINKNLYEGKRKIELKLMSGGDSQRMRLFSSGTVCSCAETDDELAIFTTGDDGLLIMDVVKRNAPTGNQKLYAREFLYPKFRKEPVDDKIIMFEAYWGGQYSCNPRALYEYIDREHPEYKCVWSLTDEKTPINGKGIRVQRFSGEYYHYLATAKYFVNNVNFENAYKKREGQIEIQTMHGTPYKSMGLDVKDDFPDEEAVNRYIKRNRRWNYLVVQGKFTESMAWQWFRYKGNMLRTGYPRTDHLFSISEEEVASLKKRKGIPADKKVIIYAPTFRQKGHYEMPLDLDLMRAELSDEYVLVIRLHHFALAGYTVPEDGEFIIDGGKDGTIDDFYKMADVLITDYSSVMFDYSLTGKKIIFFAYDLEEYTNDLRGTCFDLTEEAPGPVVRTTKEVIDAVRGDDGSYAERRAAFLDKYLTYENGRSSEMIFEEVFVKGTTRNTLKVRSVILRVVKKLLPAKMFRALRNRSVNKSS